MLYDCATTFPHRRAVHHFISALIKQRHLWTKMLNDLMWIAQSGSPMGEGGV
jgi:hypothetical protein